MINAIFYKRCASVFVCVQFTGSQESFLHVEVEEVTNDFDVYQFARGRSFMDTAQNSRTVI